tara:strand:- start:771 stop:1502 length:732 start_codon:yes stop_codon:yes gene_type:complete
MSFINLKNNDMWQLLYDSLNTIKVVDVRTVPAIKAKGLIEQIDEENNELKNTLTHLASLHPINEENKIQLVYTIIEEEKLLGFLYGNHVLNLKMQTFYTELIQRAVTITSPDDIYNTTVKIIISRIVKEKNSIISPKEFKLLSTYSTSVNNMPFMENTYCIDTSNFSELKLYQLCATRYFKKIKNEYSQKWNTIVAMKDFRVTKLYYKKHLMVGFSLYRQEDSEQFFWSNQFQEVLESLIFKF